MARLRKTGFCLTTAPFTWFAAITQGPTEDILFFTCLIQCRCVFHALMAIFARSLPAAEDARRHRPGARATALRARLRPTNLKCGHGGQSSVNCTSPVSHILIKQHLGLLEFLISCAPRRTDATCPGHDGAARRVERLRVTPHYYTKINRALLFQRPRRSAALVIASKMIFSSAEMRCASRQ